MSASHGGHSGDIIYGMALARHIASASSCLIDFYIPRDRAARLAPGLVHPNGGQYLMSSAAVEFIRPLLTLQPYINDVHFVPESEVPADAIRLDPYRFAHGMNLSAGNIADYPGKFYGIPLDVSVAWLDTPPKQSAWPVTVGFSKRYRNTAINYSFLANVDGVRFVGLPDEYEDFRSRHGLAGLAYHRCATASELAEAIRSSQVFIGNQSMAFAIAEGLKVRRALETCEMVPNVVPCGQGGGSFIYQAGLVSLLRAWGIHVPAEAAHSAPPGFVLCLPGAATAASA
ncbi:MAG: hypothetical protein KGO22_01335 [Gammaproteobacteria bacterium]|nr:hypothetical protein [Gammaproteobacteria bacterium]